jgi:hypothetical protein
MLCWHFYYCVSWSTDIWSKQCLVGISMTLSFGQQTFGQSSVQITSTWPWHLAKTMLCWHFYYCVIRSTDIWWKQCVDAVSMALTFGHHTFGQNNVWLAFLLTQTICQQTFGQSSIQLTSTRPWHLAKTIFVWRIYNPDIWLTDIGKTQCLVGISINVSFGDKTFGQNNVWLIFLLTLTFCVLTFGQNSVQLKSLWAWHLANRLLAKTMVGWQLSFGQQTFG